jgi:hypothetical protein
MIDDAVTWCLVLGAALLLLLTHFQFSKKKNPSSAVTVDEDRGWNGILESCVDSRNMYTDV